MSTASSCWSAALGALAVAVGSVGRLRGQAIEDRSAGSSCSQVLKRSGRDCPRDSLLMQFWALGAFPFALKPNVLGV
jgi:hypothetical protein